MVLIDAGDVVLGQSMPLVALLAPLLHMAALCIDAEQARGGSASPKIIVAVSTEGVDEARVKGHVACAEEGVGLWLIVAQSLRRGYPQAARGLSQNVEDGIGGQTTGKQVLLVAASAQVVAEEATAEGAYPHIGRGRVVVEAVHVGTHLRYLREGMEQSRLPVVDADAHVLGGYPQLAGRGLGHHAHHLAPDVLLTVAGLHPAELCIAGKEHVDTPEIGAYPDIVVAVAKDAVDGIVAQQVGILELLSDDVDTAVGMDDGDALLGAQPDAMVTVFGNGAHDAVGNLLRPVAAHLLTVGTHALHALAIAAYPETPLRVEEHGHDAVDAGGEIGIERGIEPADLGKRRVVGTDRRVRSHVEAVVGIDGQRHDETRLQERMHEEGVALLVVDGQVVTTTDDAPALHLDDALHVLGIGIVAAEVVGSRTVATDAPFGAHPQPLTTVHEDALHEVVAQRVGVVFLVVVALHVVAVVAGQSVASAYPDVALLVLRHRLYLLVGQSVLTGEVAKTIVGSLNVQTADQEEEQKDASHG